MKILHIITGLELGGAEKLLANVTNFQCLLHEIHIIYLKNNNRIEHLFNPSIKIIHIPLKISSHKKIRKYINQVMPDIVHTHLGHADLLGMWACRGLKLKLCCTMHNIWFKFSSIDYIIFALYFIFFKTIAKKCKVICISKAVATHVEKKLGVKKNNIFLLYNAIPELTEKLSKIESKKQLMIAEGQFIILFVGRLEKQKSVDTLLRAISILSPKIQEIKCIILGDGSKREDLMFLASQLRIDEKIVFKGLVDGPEKYFSASDVFVLPSIFEGLGIVILEAFRAGLPVVASDIEGPKELIQDGVTGMLFKPGDHVQLASIIHNIYINQSLKDTLSKNSLNSFQEHFHIARYADEIQKIYLT